MAVPSALSRPLRAPGALVEAGDLATAAVVVLARRARPLALLAAGVALPACALLAWLDAAGIPILASVHEARLFRPVLPRLWLEPLVATLAVLAVAPARGRRPASAGWPSRLAAVLGLGVAAEAATWLVTRAVGLLVNAAGVHGWDADAMATGLGTVVLGSIVRVSYLWLLVALVDDGVPTRELGGELRRLVPRLPSLAAAFLLLHAVQAAVAPFFHPGLGAAAEAAALATGRWLPEVRQPWYWAPLSTWASLLLTLPFPALALVARRRWAPREQP